VTVGQTDKTVMGPLAGLSAKNICAEHCANAPCGWKNSPTTRPCPNPTAVLEQATSLVPISTGPPGPGLVNQAPCRDRSSRHPPGHRTRSTWTKSVSFSPPPHPPDLARIDWLHPEGYDESLDQGFCTQPWADSPREGSPRISCSDPR